MIVDPASTIPSAITDRPDHASSGDLCWFDRIVATIDGVRKGETSRYAAAAIGSTTRRLARRCSLPQAATMQGTASASAVPPKTLENTASAMANTAST